MHPNARTQDSDTNPEFIISQFQTVDYRAGCPDFFQSRDAIKIDDERTERDHTDTFSNLSDFKEQESDILADFLKTENFSLREVYHERSRVTPKRKSFNKTKSKMFQQALRQVNIRNDLNTERQGFTDESVRWSARLQQQN